jgi:hypothetical protein
MQAISRRRAILSVSSGIVCGLGTVGLSKEGSAGPLTGIGEISQKEWFDTVFDGKAPVGGLHLYRFSDEIYAITKPIAWVPGAKIAKDFKRVDVPAGFITDLASVPRIFWSLLPRDGSYTYPAIIHDYMYWVQDRTRETADEIFRIGMEEFHIGSVTVNAIYWGVRAGGGLAWDANASLKGKGEQRILKRFPDEPLVSWSDWKKDPTVFE